jgi:amino acid adenylation domain-containing protein
MFVFQDAQGWSLDFPAVQAREFSLQAEQARYDLTLIVTRHDGVYRGVLEYAAPLFDATTMDRMAENLRVLLASLAAAPEEDIRRLDMLGAGEQALAGQLAAGSQEAPPPPALTLPGLVAHHARIRPQAPALECDGSPTSYQELHLRVCQAAATLRAQGLGPGQHVGLAMERSPQMVVALLAIMRVGAICIPLDLSYPAQRLAYMLHDGGARAVLTQGPLPPGVLPPGCQVIDVRSWPEQARDDQAPDSCQAQEDGAACIIYTSGSTGQPKGVLMTHGALCRVGAAQVHLAGLEGQGRVLQLAALGFDVAYGDLATTFCAGATLCLARSEDVLPGPSLARTLRRCRVTYLETPASLLAVTEPEDLPHLEVLLIGGEVCPRQVLERWGQGRRLFIAYGPTETTVAVTLAPYAGRPTVIGRPMAGARAYVLDLHDRAVPVGAAGELCIGGPTLAQGYLGRPALTAQRFQPDPFSPDPGARLYRTGDLARFLPDGGLEFLGRLDRQVKVRGYRIEPGEVEAALEELPGVARALVAPSGHVEHRGLEAWVLPSPGAGPDPAALRRALAERLPSHLVPSSLTLIKEIPLTSHGKIDWSALPSPAAPSQAEPVASQAHAGLSTTIAGIWREVLGRADIGLDENFFEAGGNSLLLVRVHAALEKALGGPLPVADLFARPSIRTLAAHLDSPDLATSPQASAPAVGRAEPLAVIGMACRYPGSPDLESFWLMLAQGREGVSRFSDQELIDAGVSPEDLARPGFVRAGGVVPDAELFDAAFFGLSPREAETMDPQQRVFLECAWHALEDAGCDPGSLPGGVGIFAGVGLNTYLHGNLYPGGALPAGGEGYQALTGNDKDFLCTQAAYRLDLRGPAVTVQTACSTSAVALDLAVSALRHGRCQVALAGGVSIRFPQVASYLHEPGMILSPDGACRAFDAEAKGTVPGGGAGVVVLKPLSQAVADGDRVWALLRGSAVNNDGALKVGFTAPGVRGQAEVIGMALADAGLEPHDLDYIEAHGTGTELGDPVEVAALAQVFGGKLARPLLLGSVKTNIGHADAAAGVAGVIKTVLALHHGLIPPSLHFRQPNPRIDFASGPFLVAAEPTPWPRGERPRRAGVSSFGIGGTNAHIILEEAPALEPSDASRAAEEPPRQVLVLSAKSEPALEALAVSLAEHLGRNPALALAEVAYTLQRGRGQMPVRLAFSAASLHEAQERLGSGLAGARFMGSPKGLPTLGYLFPGQGAQGQGMAAELYRCQPIFRQALDRCSDILLPILGLDLRPLLAQTPPDQAETAARLRATSLAQPAIFSVSYALAQLLGHWGLNPGGMLGHSIGEYVAACLAGVFNLEQALELVAQRGRLMQSLPGGSMLAVALPEEQALAHLGADLWLATVNGPRQCVISGDNQAVEALEQRLKAAQVPCHVLATSHAFHSGHMDPILKPFEELVRRIGPRRPTGRFISNVTGDWITSEQALDPAYWAQHLRSTVRFSDGLATLEGSASILLEVGPGQVLSGLARGLSTGTTALAAMPRASGAPDPLPDTLARLWVEGAPLLWENLQEGRARQRVSLPLYPFQRHRYWRAASSAPPARAEASLVKRPDPAQWFYTP